MQPASRRFRFVASLVVVVVAASCNSTTASGPPAGPATTAAADSALPVVAQPSATTGQSAATPSIETGSSVASSSVTRPGSIADVGLTPEVYRYATASQLSPAVADAKSYVYVPSNDSGTVTVIDQATMQIVDSYHVGKLVQHVVAGWDLQQLFATASDSNRLVPIDPSTGRPNGTPIPVDAPYNLYFTPDGTTAVVMAERRNRIDEYDRSTWQLVRKIDTAPCDGINHADWSLDETWFLATCEFSGGLIKVDSSTGTIIGRLDLPPGSMPQDLRLAPDGSKFYVADMAHGCVWVVDASGTSVIGMIPTDVGAHGIYPSRDSTRMYVSNRGRASSRNTGPSRDGQGSVSVIDPTTDQVVDTWHIPGGGSPDMGGVSADGTRLWLSGRFDAQVYVFDTATGDLVARIAVPPGPHGLNVFPQPGRYSLGHTGNYR